MKLDEIKNGYRSFSTQCRQCLRIRKNPAASLRGSQRTTIIRETPTNNVLTNMINPLYKSSKYLGEKT